jgi:hypothetical protein
MISLRMTDEGRTDFGGVGRAVAPAAFVVFGIGVSTATS